MRQSTRIWLLAFALAFVVGCGSSLFIRRTVYVDDSNGLVRLRATVKSVPVWVMVDPDGDGPAKPKWEPSVMDLPEGWYAGSVPAEDKE